MKQVKQVAPSLSGMIQEMAGAAGSAHQSNSLCRKLAARWEVTFKKILALTATFE